MSLAAGVVIAALVAGWLAPAALTTAGCRRRGNGWGLAVLGGLLFPLAWAGWYLRDRHRGTVA